MTERFSLLKNSFWLLAATVVGGAMNYGFNLLIARQLGPADYGEFGALMGLLGIAIIPATVVGTVASRFVADLVGRHRLTALHAFWHKLTRLTLGLAGIVVVIYATLVPWLKTFLHIDSTRLFGLFGVLIVGWMLMLLNRSFLLGTQRFVATAANSLVEPATKLTVGLGLILGLGLRVDGALLAVITSTAVAYLAVFVSFRPTLVAKLPTDELPSTRGYSLVTTASVILGALLTNVDIVLAKHYFDPITAGQYVALSTASKILIFLAGPAATATLPMVTHAVAEGRKHVALLVQAFAGTTTVALVVLAIFAIAPELTMRTLYGPAYVAVAPLLVRYGFAMLLYSLVTLWINYYLAVDERRFLLPLAAAVALEVGLMALFHGSATTLIQVFTGSLLVAFVGFSTLYVWLKRVQLGELLESRQWPQ